MPEPTPPGAAPPSATPPSGGEFEVLHELVRKARQNLNQNNWDYIVGGTETETTVRRNRLALDSLALRARVLRDVNHVDASTTRLGRKLRLPVLLAPVGSIESFDPGGGATIVRAAGEFGVAHMLSSVCKPHLEGVADAAQDATRIYQLYVRSDAAATDAVVRRVIDRGYRAFCMTVDSAVYSRRERDLAKRHRTAGRLAVEGRNFQAALAWDTVKRVRDNFDIPIVLKGIQSAEDALLAVEHGVEWIYVSNHGGRQLDHGQGSMEVLPAVVEAVKGRAKIIVDGGFCRGTDIVKAIAAGADLVGLGRMQCFAVAAAGQAGVVRMLELLEDEVQRCLMLVGAARLADLDRSFLAPAQPVNLPHVLSAFPLLEIERYRY
jgi:glycolate oxidase